MKKVLALFSGSLLLVSCAFATQQYLGGYSLPNTITANPLPPGRLSVGWQTRTWFKSIDGAMISDMSQAVPIAFGFNRHTELELTPIIYQDLNISAGPEGATYNAMDDLYVRFKWLGYNVSMFNRTFTLGAHFSTRMATSNYTNVYLEPYSSDANELSLGGVVSYFSNQLYPEEAWSAHFNLTYHNYNDGGKTDDVDLFSGSTQALEYAMAYKKPGLRWTFAGELYGNFFTERPSNYAQNPTSAAWLKPSVSYKLFAGMSIDLGLDLLLFEDSPHGVVVYDDPSPRPTGFNSSWSRPSADYPEFNPPFRFCFGMTFQPSTAFNRVDTFSRDVRPTSQRDWESRQSTGMTEREMIDWLSSEENSAEYLDLELEKIRAQRREAEQELERLRRKMNNQGE